MQTTYMSPTRFSITAFEILVAAVLSTGILEAIGMLPSFWGLLVKFLLFPCLPLAVFIFEKQRLSTATHYLKVAAIGMGMAYFFVAEMESVTLKSDIAVMEFALNELQHKQTVLRKELTGMNSDFVELSKSMAAFLSVESVEVHPDRDIQLEQDAIAPPSQSAQHPPKAQ